jgi:hypothetical protein
MSTARKLSPSVAKASREAAEYDYDKSKYVIIDSGVRRDPKSGRLIQEESDRKR